MRWRIWVGRRRRRPTFPEPPSLLLRRGDFLLDLDGGNVERAVRQLRGAGDEDLEARLEVGLGAGDRGGDDGLRRYQDLLLLIRLVLDLVLHGQDLTVDGGDRGLQ